MFSVAEFSIIPLNNSTKRMNAAIEQDVAAISRIEAVQMILKTISRSTKMRVSLVSRMTDDSWTACAVIDDANFGLQTGSELDLASTY